MGSIPEELQNGVSAKTAQNIIDIRSDAASINLKQEITAGLQTDREKIAGEKRLPTLLLYDDEGLKLFERITYLEQYYLTGDEINVLEKHADSIAKLIPDNSMLVELGSGNLRKVSILLLALDRAKKHVSYYALDLMKSELERTLNQVQPYEHVKCFGLHGTYDDGLEFLKRPEYAMTPKTILSLGSSIGNFTRADAAAFLKQFANLLGVNDSLIIGLDGCQDPERVYDAYNDREGVTHQFTLNGLVHANRLLGYDAFNLSDWDAIGEYDQQDGKHRAYVVPNKDVTVEGTLVIRAGERVNFEESYKYNDKQSANLWSAAELFEKANWANVRKSYGLHMLERSSTNMFPTQPAVYAAHPVPSLDDFKQLWATWDQVTRQMIPEDQLHSKPIDLRNACIFYLGHIPTFFDMKIVEATGGKPTEPSYFYKIFERGIDPDVDNPEQCHAHSEIPDEWPDLDEILLFQSRLRHRVTNIYESGKAYSEPWTGRAMWLGLEHEIMHLETLLYMLLQSDKTRAPTGAPKPDFEKLAADSKRNAVDNEWFDIPEQIITIGLEDPDNSEGPTRYFGWDIEKPSRTVKVPGLKAKARPITNEEYARYLCATGSDLIPVSWIKTTSTNGTNGVNGHANDDKFSSFIRDKAVRTVYGPVPLEYALDWPVATAYDELAGCAQYMGGRIPTHEEARSIYTYAEISGERGASNALDKTIPAVNGHLSNNGVQETPPSKPSINGASAAANNAATGLDPNDLFVDLDDSNVGFKRWHPAPVTQNGNRLAGQGGMGGLWEWTSSKLKKQKGFAPMELYPAFSQDFFDDKHNIVLGGSWATHPRLAGRKTFVNWYQPNYRYVWAGARLVKDA